MASNLDNIALEVKSVNEINLKKESVAGISIWFTRCDVIYIKTFAVAIGEDFSSEDATAIAYGAFKACDEVEQKK